LRLASCICRYRKRRYDAEHGRKPEQAGNGLIFNGY